MIHHTVFFKLKFPADSDGEYRFFESAKVLTIISGVQDFERMKEISPKNPYEYGFDQPWPWGSLRETVCHDTGKYLLM